MPDISDITDTPHLTAGACVRVQPRPAGQAVPGAGGGAPGH